MPRSIVAFALLAFGLVGSARAQEFEELHTDRDAFVPATRSVDTGHTLVEGSFAYIDNRGSPETYSFPELLVRRGVTDRFELRFGVNYESGSGGSVVSPVETGEGLEGRAEGMRERESNILYGCKLWLTDDAGWVPRSSLVVEAFTPLSGDVWGTEPTAMYAFGWALPGEWRFEALARYVYADSIEGTFDKWNAAAVLRVPVTERFEVHAEWFTTYTIGLDDDTVRPFVGPGMHYLVTPRFEIGSRFGWGLTHDAAGFFLDAGAAVRF